MSPAVSGSARGTSHKTMAKPAQQNFGLEFPSQSVSFDPEAFDELIRSQGIQFIHYRSMACPVGLTDPDDIRRAHEHHINCSNGRIYIKAGKVTCGFQGDSGGTTFMDAGRLDGSTVTCVLPRFYDDPADAQIDINYADRMYLVEEGITATTDCKFAAHITGVDRLCFPAVHVIDLMDAKGRIYKECVDFCVKDGMIHWNDGQGPGIDPDSGKGVVCSALFTYRPFWYVKSLPHEVRVAQIEDEYFNRKTMQMPKQVVLQREYHDEKAQRDGTIKDPENRQKPTPSDGSFGSR